MSEGPVPIVSSKPELPSADELYYALSACSIAKQLIKEIVGDRIDVHTFIDLCACLWTLGENLGTTPPTGWKESIEKRRDEMWSSEFNDSEK